LKWVSSQEGGLNWLYKTLVTFDNLKHL